MLHIDESTKFDALVENVARCDLCPRMKGRNKVLSLGNGSLNSKVMFIGEAPGRLGADKTLIPFLGDQSGRNLGRLLDMFGFTRKDIFITNAVLCNPRNAEGNNAPPTLSEIRNCSIHLGILLDVIRPEYIVTLGIRALDALNAIERHSIELKRDTAKPIRWSNSTVLPLYHPGPRALIHRKLHQQASDFLTLGDVLDKQVKSHSAEQIPLFDTFSPSLEQKVIYRIVSSLKHVSKFKLAKLLYLLDWHEIQETGTLLTGYYYIFQKNGPLATGLSKSLEALTRTELLLYFYRGNPHYRLGSTPRHPMDLPNVIEWKVDQIVNRFGHRSDIEIKMISYMTPPIKDFVRKISAEEDVLNKPVFDGQWFKRSM